MFSITGSGVSLVTLTVFSIIRPGQAGNRPVRVMVALSPAAIVPAAVAPAAPVAIAPAPAPILADAPAPVAVVPEAAPADADLVEIDPNEVPLAAGEGLSNGAWALLNLIIAIFTLLLGIVLFVTMFKRNKKAEEQPEEYVENDEVKRNPKSGLGWRVLAILCGILSPIVFLLTENILLPMIFVDRWTIVMVIILIVQLAGMALLRHARNKEEDDEQTETPAMA